MADPKLTMALAKAAEAKKKEEADEEKKVAGDDVPEGHLRVRLIRPKTTADGKYLVPGIYVLPEAQVPKSAKVLAGERTKAAAK